MADYTTAQILAQLAALQEKVARQEAALRRTSSRRRTRPIVAILALGVLVALLPLVVLAATPFTDLTAGSPHNDNIQAIFDAGITKGCDPTHYCPTANVTREEMASFLARTAGLGANPPVANARTLQGYAPNGLVRALRGAHIPVVTLTADDQDIVTVTITAPGPGFVLVQGSLIAGAGATGTNLAFFHLVDQTTGATSPLTEVAFNRAGTDLWVGSVGPTDVFPVGVDGGPQTFALAGRVTKGAINTTEAVITALFVPFGPTGTAP
jgi:hypothetical protein